MSETLEALASRAAGGDRAALDQLVRAIKDDVYGLALRMLGLPAEAEDATQEILIKVVTHLGSFRADSGLRTWVWRIAANHVLNMKRGAREAVVSYDLIEAMIGEGEGIAPYQAGSQAESDLLALDVKIACTQAMLLALDRDLRLAYLLGEVFELSSSDAAAVLDLDPATFRKRLSRARGRLASFMGEHCGVVNPKAACRCDRQIPVVLKHDFMDPAHLLYVTHRVRARVGDVVANAMTEMSAIEAAAAGVFRSHPQYEAPDSVIERIREIIVRSPLFE